MSYAGHVLDVIQRMRNNRNLVGKRDRLFSGLNKKIVHSYRHHGSHQKALSKEERDKLRRQLIHENRMDLLKKGFAFVLALSIVIILLIMIRSFLDLEDFMIYNK